MIAGGKGFLVADHGDVERRGFRDRGEREMKGIAEPVRLFAVRG